MSCTAKILPLPLMAERQASHLRQVQTQCTTGKKTVPLHPLTQLQKSATMIAVTVFQTPFQSPQPAIFKLTFLYFKGIRNLNALAYLLEK